MHRTPEGQAFRFSLRNKGWYTDEGLEPCMLGGGTQEDIDRHIRVFNQLGKLSLIDDVDESLKQIHIAMWRDGWNVHQVGNDGNYDEETGLSVWKGWDENLAKSFSIYRDREWWSAEEWSEIEKTMTDLMRARAAARKASILEIERRRPLLEAGRRRARRNKYLSALVLAATFFFTVWTLI